MRQPFRPTWRHGLIALLLAAALATVFANRVPFWPSMSLLMGAVAVAAGLLLRRAGEPVFAPSWADTFIGLALAVASWGAVVAVLPVAERFIPPIGDGLVLVAGYAAAQPVLWQYLGVALIAPAEELFWRHYVPWVFAGWHGFERYTAQLAVVPLYAGMHLFSGTLWLAVPALAFGTAWGLLTAWRRSPWAAIVWHLVFDLLVFIWFPPGVRVMGPGV